jgi:toxin FitB
VSYLLDTNVVSEVRRPTPNQGVRDWFATVTGPELYLSVLLVGEVRQGIERLHRRDAGRADVYEEWLATLRRDYSDRVLPITADIAEEWGRLNAGDPIPVIDGLMAATAKVHALTLVTRSVGDVARTGVHLLNPFEER